MLHHPAPYTLPHRGDHLRQGLEGLLCQGVPDQHDQHSQVDQEDGKEEEDQPNADPLQPGVLPLLGSY